MDEALRLVASLQLERGAAMAFAVALLVGLAARWRRYRLLAGIAAGLGVLAGWWAVFGTLTASPRQLPERLPLLALVLPAIALPAAALARRWPWAGWAGAAVGAGFTAWWMAGAPLTPADLLRVAPAFAVLAGATVLLTVAAAPRWAPPVAAAALLAGLLAVPLAGPAPILGAALLAAALGASIAGPAQPAAPLPVAGALVALAAVPVIARGGTADWAVAAAPFAALAVGAPLASRLWGPRAALAGAALFGAAGAFFAFLLR